MKIGNLKFEIIFLYLLFFFSPWGGQRGASQQLPSFSQYMVNDLYLNPAVTGTKEAYIAAISLRMQWFGFKDAPATQAASFQGPFFRNMGLGAVLFSDKTLPYSQTGLQLSYAYRLTVMEDAHLSFGLGGMMYEHKLDKDHVTLDEQNDNAVYGAKERAFVPDADFGLYYYTKSYYAGLSVPQLIQARMKFNDAGDKVTKQVRHVFLHGGYKYKVNHDVEVEPSLLLKAIFSAPEQLDLNLKVHYKEMAWGGLSYRNKESVILLLGVTKNNFTAGYSYDITLSRIRNYSTGTHEIYIGLKIPGAPN